MIKKVLRSIPVTESRFYVIGASLAGFIILTFGVLIAHRSRMYISDDTVIQVIVNYWQAGLHQQAFLPADNFLFHQPFYVLLNAFNISPIRQLLLSAMVFNWIAYGALLANISYVWKRFVGKYDIFYLLVVLWFASLFTWMSSQLMLINSRGLDIGIALGILLCIVRYLTGDSMVTNRKEKIVAATCLVVFSLLLYADPYFMYVFFAPLLLLSVKELLQRNNRNKRSKFLYLTYFLLASLILSMVTKFIAKHLLGITSESTPVNIVTTRQLFDNLHIWANGFLDLYHANIFGLQINKPDVVLIGMSFILVTIVFIRTWKGAMRLYAFDVLTDPKEFIKVFFILSFIITSLVMIFSSYTSISGAGANRYLLWAVFLSPLLLICAWSELKNDYFRIALVALISIVTISNMVYLVSRADAPRASNSLQYEVRDVVRENGLTKGYADYWSAPINTFFAEHKTDFIQVSCKNHVFSPNGWLLETATLDIKAGKTFYLYEPDTEVTQSCSEADVVKQFGAPEKLIQLSDGRRLYIFSYDIVSRMGEIIPNRYE